MPALRSPGPRGSWWVPRPASVRWTVLALVLALASPATGQSSQPADAPSPARLRFEAVRALREGRYADVLTSTAALPREPDVALLRGRALAATGRYAEAAAELEPAATPSTSGEAVLALAELLQLQGREADARRRLDPLVRAADGSDDGETLGLGARAAYLLQHYEEANDLFRRAAARIGDDPRLQLAWGALFLEKHNRAEAVRSYRAALQGDRRNPEAWAGLARALADENAATARELAGRALGLNASLVEAHLVLADLALDEDKREEARRAIDAALSVNPRSLDALSRRAAVAYLEDREEAFEATAREALAINPRYGEIYRLTAAQAARHYRFDDAVTLVRKALELDPRSARAHADLGVHLLRTGEEREARQSLEVAFRADPYDLVTYNLLGMLDNLDTFVTIEDGPITMRLHPDEATVLREHAVPLARRALETLAKRYRIDPSPVLIEIFPRHDDFAVRNVGLPGMVGALGACFGRVVTLDSPRARPPGTFNWQATLWHEMAHVITLQMSKNRIPRWLTEGVSVFEEQRARPAWGRDMELAFADALQRGETIPLADLNAGFMNPETISLAYYQASLLVDHLLATYGEAALGDLIRAYGDGLSTDDAMERAMGVTLADVEPAFAQHLQSRFAAVLAAREGPEDLALSARTPRARLEALAREHPGHYEIHLRLGQARAAAGDADGAYAAWGRAARILPAATGDGGPWARIARLSRAEGDLTRAAHALEQQLAREDANIEAARQLVELIDADQEPERAARAWALVAEMDPFDARASATLGRRALDARDAPEAARWFRAALAAGPTDRAAAHCDLAESYLAAGATSLAKRQVLAALEVAPTYARAQELLLGIVDGAP